MSNMTIRGISFCNPNDLTKEYVDYVVDYAIRKHYDHLQFIGPIHNPIKGNIDGMALYKKYSQFNDEKDLEYVKQSIEIVNSACEKTSKLGIKSYVWHHELDLPNGFKEAYPEILNEYGDVEVSSPEVEDFLKYKIIDFFEQYPLIDGIVLTLHETKVPLLKLKNQKLDKIERVKFVTKILFDTCNSLGKELIVRPFASIEEDYEMMTKAYEEISHDMIIMDKWTQFDWSLTLPHNRFFNKIKNNPLFVETDIFGEYFGKGRLPLMLKDHIIEKYKYCEGFNPVGYCSRIDRNGAIPFGSANEVNLDIMHACLSGEDVDTAIDNFFNEKYGKMGPKIRELMEPTEELNRKMFSLKGYYFSELSRFPRVNHCKNHFYFEMMKEDYKIVSNEWYIPQNWTRGEIQELIDEKDEVVNKSQELYDRLVSYKDQLDPEAYKNLFTIFFNQMLCSKVWKTLVLVFMNYTKFFETGDTAFETAFYKELDQLAEYNKLGRATLESKFHCSVGDDMVGQIYQDYIATFLGEITDSFEAEKKAYFEKKAKNLYDFVVCGGGYEGHKIMKEVNFSDTVVQNGMVCRIPGNNKGKVWSQINCHGWFSYELKVRAGQENTVKVYVGSETEQIDLQIALGDKTTVVNQKADGISVIELKYTAKENENEVRIRFDRMSGYTPCVYSIEVL